MSLYILVFIACSCMTILKKYTRKQTPASHSKQKIKANVELHGLAIENGVLYSKSVLCNFVFVNLLCITDKLIALLQAILSHIQN